MSRFHPLQVARVDPETRDAVAVTFAVPAALAAEFRFEPGQHLTLRATVGGSEVRRSYSICAAPRDATLPADPRERAMLLCGRAAQSPCQLYAVDRAVVWKKEP